MAKFHASSGDDDLQQLQAMFDQLAKKNLDLHKEILSRLDAQGGMLEKVLTEIAWQTEHPHQTQATQFNILSNDAVDDEKEQLNTNPSDKTNQALMMSPVVSLNYRGTTGDLSDHDRPPTHVKKAFTKLVDTQTNLQRSVTNFWFEFFLGVLVVANSLWIGIEVEYQASHDRQSNSTTVILTCGNYAFNLIFCLELLIRLKAYGLHFFLDGQDINWNYFDLFLVLSSLVEMAIDIIGLAMTVKSSKLRTLRIFRVTRLLRFLRISRLVRVVKPMRILVQSMFNTFKSVVSAMLLLVVIIYFFAILFTQAANQHLTETSGCKGTACPGEMTDLWRRWGTIPRSMYSLFKCISEGEDWGESAASLSAIHGMWLVIFIMYFVFVYYALLNVVTGFYCQNAIEGAQRDRELMISNLIETKSAHMNNIKQQFQRIFASLNKESDNLSYQEFCAIIDDEHVSGFFALLDIDSSDAYALFRLLDDDGSGAIDAAEFVEGCMRIGGPARSIDLAQTRAVTKKKLKKITECITLSDAHVEQIAQHLEKKLNAILQALFSIPPHSMPLSRKETLL